jgi:hypothetical protein
MAMSIKPTGKEASHDQKCTKMRYTSHPNPNPYKHRKTSVFRSAATPNLFRPPSIDPNNSIIFTATTTKNPFPKHTSNSPKMSINWWTVGSLYGAASVAFGAFGAHGLKSRGISDAKIASWSTAAHYQVNIQYLPIVSPSNMNAILTFLSAHPLRRPRSCRDSFPRQAEDLGEIAAYRGHDDVQRFDLFACAGSAALQGYGAYYAVGWCGADWWVGGVGRGE